MRVTLGHIVLLQLSAGLPLLSDMLCIHADAKWSDGRKQWYDRYEKPDEWADEWSHEWTDARHGANDAESTDAA